MRSACFFFSMKSFFLWVPLLLIVGLTQAQQPSIPKVEETVVVLGVPEPVSTTESARSVMILDTTRHPLTFSIPEDAVRSDPSTLIEQRGAGGAQADISIRGSSFEQTLVLLNGLRIDDAQTSHHNFDLPVPLEALRGMEVLHGAGSTLYGSDALGGVVDFLTAQPLATGARLRAGLGSYGENEESFRGTLNHPRGSEVLAADRNFSTGFLPDRDYRNENASSETGVKTTLGLTDLLLAASDRAFGADQFYGPYNSWERTKGWFASVRQELGDKTEAAFGYRRHADNFILLRNDPSFYANNHVDSSWQGVVRRKQELGPWGSFFCGLEANGDGIESNNLGLHARNRGAGYVDVAFPQTRLSVNLGLREEILSGGRSVLSPDLAGSFRVGENLKLRASIGYGFRLPTYTDLYYSDPSTLGNSHLKPESAWSEDAGLDWSPGQNVNSSLTIFYSREHDAIDYVRSSPSLPWQATNLNGLRFAGVEETTRWLPTAGQELDFGWTVISGAQRALGGLESEYVFNYPVQNANFTWKATVNKSYFLSTRVAVIERYHRDPYPVWGVSAAREGGRLHPYIRIENLANTGYDEIERVRMPGRTFTGGIEISFRNSRKEPAENYRMGR
jgi:outer membrane cobalamin receptor